MIHPERWCITLFGNGGKSALISRYMTKSFLEEYDPTIEETLFSRVVVDGKITDLEVVDTSGAEQFTSFIDLCIRASDGFILTYSITSRRSFEELSTVYNNIVRVKQEARPTFMIVGNNSENDLEREVSRAEAQALGQQWGCLWMEASAKRGWNVERIFSDTIRALRANRDRDTRAQPSQASVQTSVSSGGLKGPIIRARQEALVTLSSFFASSREKDKGKGKRQEYESDRDRSRPFDDDDRTFWDMPRLIGYSASASHEDWAVVVEVCDKANQSEVNAKEASKAVCKDIQLGRPATQLLAARLWAIMLINCYTYFIAQTATRKFLGKIEEVVLSPTTSLVVRDRLVEVIGGSVFQLKDTKHLKNYVATWKKLRSQLALNAPLEGIKTNPDDPILNPAPGSLRQHPIHEMNWPDLVDGGGVAAADVVQGAADIEVSPWERVIEGAGEEAWRRTEEVQTSHDEGRTVREEVWAPHEVGDNQAGGRLLLNHGFNDLAIGEIEPTPSHSSFVLLTPQDVHASLGPPDDNTQSFGRQQPSSKEEIVVPSNLSAPEMFQCLLEHGCVDVSSRINPDRHSTTAVAGGSFGDIWMSELDDGTKVAIKCLRFHAMAKDRPKGLKRATREIYMWSKAKHPNVHELMGVVMFQGRLGMVSMWMENGSLHEYIQTNPDVDRYQLCIQAATGVSYLHSIRMVHGDIKALNILVSRDGVAKLSDFDHSILSNGTLAFSATTNVGGGTLRWMAPELLASTEDGNIQPATRTTQTDIYALGMTILEIVTGKVPYSEYLQDLGIIRALDRKKPPVRPKEFASTNEQANAVWTLLLQCWDHDAATRPDASSVLTSLQKIIGRSTLSS